VTTFEKKVAMKKEKHELMISLVNKWKGSGIPVRTYAQQIGVSKSKFEYWVRKQKAITDTNVPFTEFIEVGPLAENRESANDACPAQAKRTPQIELTFPSGLCIKIYG
jgi:hypothetical protein